MHAHEAYVQYSIDQQEHAMPMQWENDEYGRAQTMYCASSGQVCTKILTELTRCGYSHPKRQEREVVASFEQG